MSKMAEDEILINKVFTGKFISDFPDNIGHEFINFYKSDDGNNYIYINYSGTIDKGRNVKTVLFVKKAGKGLYKIVARADGLKLVEDIGITEHKIKYGGLELEKIYSTNTYNSDNSKYCTFKVDTVKRPLNNVYIATKSREEETLAHVKIEELGRMTRYIKESDKEYKSLSDVINKQEWVEITETLDKCLGEIKQKNKFINNDFIKLIGKENIELTYSNLLQYFFYKDKEKFKEFVQTVLNIKNFGLDYRIEREHLCKKEDKNKQNSNTSMRKNKRIDLLITDSENKIVIVIENKIKSGISQLEENDNNDKTKNKTQNSQLDEYYKYITKNKEFEKYNSKFFIFLPDYNTACEDEIKTYNAENPDKKWEIKKYSKIFEFYNKKENCKIPYFNEFLYALYKQSDDNYWEADMNERLYKAVNKYSTND